MFAFDNAFGLRVFYGRSKEYIPPPFLLVDNRAIEMFNEMMVDTEKLLHFNLPPPELSSHVSLLSAVLTLDAIYAGIYVGGNKVVHFTREQNSSSGDYSASSISSPGFSTSSSKVPSTCPNFPDCGFRQPESGVVLSCLDCFLGCGSLYHFEYGVTPSIFLAKLRGGTCTTAETDAPEAVIDRAMYLLRNGFGNYDVFKNNCEDFALYCKTGFLILDQTSLGRSGQAASIVGAPLAALLSSSLKLFLTSPVGVVAATAGMYCMSRYATDIGVRTDIVKVKVEDFALFHGWNGPKVELAEDNEFKEEPSHMCSQVDAPASKRQRCRNIILGGTKLFAFTSAEASGSPFCSFSLGSSFRSSSSGWSRRSKPICPKDDPDCGDRQPESGVALSCLDCFLGRTHSVATSYLLITSKKNGLAMGMSGQASSIKAGFAFVPLASLCGVPAPLLPTVGVYCMVKCSKGGSREHGFI
ncbi:hypothetical protein RJ640_019121 [Escallonia rubra]|uniref:LRAT domain-containing protein n=1 Tax=Escallonia rubra TaxID=112253 RepID=A0AA88QX38_9ASTE|nr:hypothetical protein RJ640_019121 [Escallonia rubra]